jgi:hypothetical protein
MKRKLILLAVIGALSTASYSEIIETKAVEKNTEDIRKNFSTQYSKNKELEEGISKAKTDSFRMSKNLENVGNLRYTETTGKLDENKDKTEVNEKNIADNKTAIDNNSGRITNLDNKVNNLQGEMNKGFAMSAAMSTVDFQALEVGELGIGAGIGNYQNAQAVSLGLGLRATDNLSMNVKGAMSTGTKQETMIGAGATYKIRVFGS